MDQSTRILTISQAAARLGVHANTLRGWADRGLVNMIRLPSGHRRFSLEEIERLRTQMGMSESMGKAAA